MTNPMSSAQNASQTPGGQSGPMPPGPLPTQIGLRTIMYGQQKLVVLEINTPFGTVFPHLTLEVATELGAALTQLTASGRTGLVLPPNARL